MAGSMNHILFFGFGFSAEALTRRLDPAQWRITGTSRSEEGAARLRARGVNGVRFDALNDIPDDVTHIVSSVPPGDSGDPVLLRFGAALQRQVHRLTWAAYLSTTGVYGDHGGAWIDEATTLTPNTERGRRRLAAEEAWLRLHRLNGLPLHIFRLAGIYGPGRNQLETVLDGTAKRIIKEGQVFSRIHVDDIAGILLASMARPHPGTAYNVADDDPCPPQDVVEHAAELLGKPVPPAIAFADAELSPMARSFYADSKRVANRRVKEELGYRFLYPSFHEGLAALLPGAGKPQ
jgi:nucleoside-diphosphate-sugar epimerase